MNLLAVDVGNTNVVVGWYREGGALDRTWRTATDHTRTEDELAVTIDALLAQVGGSLSEVEAIVLGSVVPPLTSAFERLIEKHRLRSLIIGPGVKTGVRLRVDNPSEVGADRIANTLAAHRRYPGPPVVVVDFGTSTNLDVVSAEGDFLGGSFAPGLEVAAESLFDRASRLFRVPLSAPKQAIGKNTVDCLRSGIVFGYVGLIEGLVRRISEELPVKPRVVATGGYASTIAPLTSTIEEVDADLTLEGLRLLWDLNA